MPAQLTILSGKGGTGKTTVAASFFQLSGDVVAADCDVDAPNMHLLLEPVLLEKEAFQAAMVSGIETDTCTECGLCVESCKFGAIGDFEVDPYLCEGCGVCELVCPEGAARLFPADTGEVFISETKFGPLAHALLKPGGEATGKLVTRVKDAASQLSEERGIELILVDGSPGIGCPVIASIAGSDLILAVTEPTLSGLWGLERVHGVARHFGVELAVCINKVDINPEIAERIRCYCSDSGLTVAGAVPFDEEVNEATMNGDVLVEKYDGPAAGEIRSLWKKTISLLESVKAKTQEV